MTASIRAWAAHVAGDPLGHAAAGAVGLALAALLITLGV